VFREKARARIKKQKKSGRVFSSIRKHTSTYFPAFQCVCILLAWEKKHHEKNIELRKAREK